MNTIIAYAYSFLSTLLPMIKKNVIKNIILFGSSARDELTKDSDVDLFIELYDINERKNTEETLKKALIQFEKSDKYKEWKLRGVDNEIKCLVGTLDEQSDLKRSLISNGISLYSKYFEPIKGKNYTLISLKVIQDKNKRYKVLRRLFGRTEKNKTMKGLIEKFGGKQLSTRVFIIPLEQTPAIINFLKEENVDYSLNEITTD